MKPIMQPLLFIDFETRSLLDLTEVGLHRYARHPSTSPWCMSFALNDDEPIVWLPSNKNLPPWIQKHIQDGLPVIAHSAAFELEVWNEIMVPLSIFFEFTKASFMAQDVIYPGEGSMCA